MSIGRLASAVLVFTFQTIAAPQDLLSHISIQVVDVSGARIPSAAVEVVSSTGSVNKIHADKTGEALIDLPRGTYEVTISALAFQRKTETLEVADRAGQVLEVKLAIDPNQEGYSGPVVDQSFIPEEHAAPLVQLPSAQVPLRVMVKDQSGAFIPEARIEVRSSEAGTSTVVKTDARGEAMRFCSWIRAAIVFRYTLRDSSPGQAKSIFSRMEANQ